MAKAKFKADSPRSFKGRMAAYIVWFITYAIAMLTLMPLLAATIVFVFKGDFFSLTPSVLAFLNLGPHRWLSEALALGHPQALVIASIIFTILFSALLMYVEFNPTSKRNSRKALFGPAAEKTHEHGSAVVETKERALKENTRRWDPTKPFPYESAGVVYGSTENNREVFVSSGEGHTVIVGPTGKRKTRGTLLPTIFAIGSAGDALVAIDPKSELYTSSHRWLEKVGYKVVLLDFRNSKRSWNWNPLTDLIEVFFGHKDEAKRLVAEALADSTKRVENFVQAQTKVNRANEEAEALAKDIAEIFVPMEVGADEASFWKDSARVMIYALILLVSTYDKREVEAYWKTKLKDKNLSVVRQREIKAMVDALPKEIDVRQRSFASVEWLVSKKGTATRVVDKGVRKTEMGLKDIFGCLPDDHVAKAAFAQALTADAEPLASIVSTVHTKLENLLSRSFKSISYESSFTMKDLMDKKVAVFVVIPDEDRARAPIGIMFIQLLYKAMVKLSNANGGVLPKKLHIIIEEKGSLARGIPGFATMLAVARSRRISFIFAIQNYEQMIELYGVYGAANILDNCNTTIFLGTNSVDTAEKISRRLGTYTYAESVTSSSKKIFSMAGDSVGESRHLRERRWLTADEVLRWDRKNGAIVFRSSPDAENRSLLGWSLIESKLTNPAIFNAPDISETPANALMGLGSKEHNRLLWLEDEQRDKSPERKTVVPWNGEPAVGVQKEKVVFEPGEETEDMRRLIWVLEEEESRAQEHYLSDERYFAGQAEESEKEPKPSEKPPAQNTHKERAEAAKLQIAVMMNYMRSVVLATNPPMDLYEDAVRREKRRIKEHIKQDIEWNWTPQEELREGGVLVGRKEESVPAR